MNMDECPGSRTVDLRQKESQPEQSSGTVQSQLRQWPIQLHLVSPAAPYYQGADVLLSADCVAYALGGFHSEHLKGKSIAIACPKLDEGQDVYLEKITSMFDEAQINTLTVMVMQVPCCSGLLNLAVQASQQAKRKVPLKCLVVSLEGEILQDEWVEG
jgi:hypothetical protein